MSRKASFSQNKEWITRTNFVYKTSRLVRISLLFSALNKRVLFFSRESYFIKAIENFFSCSVFAHPDINTLGVWRIHDRCKCKPETKSRVCIAVSNSSYPRGVARIF